MSKQGARRVKRIRGLLIGSAALVLVGAIGAGGYQAVKHLRDRKAGKDVSEGVMKSYIYGTMDEYMAAPSVSASSASYSLKTVTVAASPASGGNVTPSTSVAEGSTITLNATPASGFRFDHWSNDGGTTAVSNSASFVTPAVTGDVTYTAVFVKESYVITGRAKLDSVFSDVAGVVTGGGTLSNDSDKVTLTASNAVNGYRFDGWYLDGNATGKSSNSVSFGLSASDADIKLDADNYKTNDPEIYARYLRSTDDMYKTITASVIPAQGHIELILQNQFSIQPDGPSKDSVVILDKDGQWNNALKWHFRVGTTSDPGATEAGKTVHEYMLSDVKIEYDDQAGVIQKQAVSSSDYTKSTEEEYMISHENLKNYVNRARTFLNIYVVYKGVLSTTYERLHSVTTAANPSDYGVTSGDASNTITFATNVKAMPYEGYAFDHWEWVEGNVVKTSKDNPMNVSVNGQKTCIAYFTKAKYNVSIASMSPAGGGIVKKGLGSYGYKENVAVEIVPNDGYEFQSCTYTQDGVSHTSESPNFTISEIKEDISLNVNFRRTKFTVSARPEPLGNESGSYNKVKLGSGDKSQETTDTQDFVEQPLTSQGSVVLEAIANTAAGYKFDRWVGTDGTVSTDNPYTPSNVNKDVTYIAKFTKGKYKISVQEDPAGHGNAYVYGTVSSDNILKTLEVDLNGSATIKAEPANGYKFSYWTNQTGTKLYEEQITLKEIKSDETYTAHFTTDIEITVGSTPDGIAELIFNNITPGSTTTSVNKVPGGSDITLEAKLQGEENIKKYKFVRWQDGSGFTYTSNPVRIVNVTNSDTFTAIFEPVRCTISVNEDPTDGGKTYVKGNSAFKKQGSDEVDVGGSATIEAEPNAGYTFMYWTSTLGTRYTEKKMTLSDIGNDETFTAHFAKGKVSVSVNSTPAGAGTIKAEGTEGGASKSETGESITGFAVDGRSNVTLTAYSSDENKYRFARWVDGKGSSYNTNPLEVVDITEDSAFTAIFTPVDDTNGITVKAVPPEGGTVSKQIKSDGSGTEIKAAANPGYRFLYWQTSSGTKLTNAAETVQNVGWDEVYTAYFAKEKVSITLETSPADAGEIWRDGAVAKAVSEAKKTIEADGGSNVRLTAVSADENMYKFAGWKDSRGNSYNTNPLELTEVMADETYTAVFTSTGETNSVTVKAVPPEGGTVSKNVNSDGTTTVKAVTNAGYKFLYWQTSSGTKLTNSTETVQNVGWDEVYTAYFAKDEVKLTLITSPADAAEIRRGDNGEVVKKTTDARAEINVAGGSDIRLTAVSKDENLYKFAGWRDSRGNSYNTNPLELIEVKADETYTAVFTSTGDSNGLTVKASPPEGGTVEKTINNDGTTTIKANANGGYSFLYWMSSTGTKIMTAEAKLTAVGWDEVYTAYFSKNNVTLSIRSMPDGAGTVKARGTENGAGKEEKGESFDFKVDGRTNVILTAFSSDENQYRFMKWEDSRGNSYSTNPLELADVTADETYTAMFSKVNDVNSITVKATPPEGGTVSKEIDPDTGATTINAVANEGFEFMYWMSSTGTKMTNAKVTLSNVGWNEEFTAYFKSQKVNITIDVSPKDSGVVELDSNGYVGTATSYQVDGGTNHTLTAQSNDSQRYKFLKWEDSRGNFYTDNPLEIVNITADEKFTAIFEGIDEEVGITVKASPAAGGRVSKKLNSDGTYTITAQPNNGYRYKGWYLDKTKLTDGQSYTFAEYKDGNVYTAYFELDKSYNARSDISYERFANVTRIYSALNYTVTRSTMQSMASSQVAKDRAQIGNPAPGSKDYGAYATVRERNARKYESANDRSALLIDGELVTTHAELVSAVTIEDATAEDKAKQFTLGKFGDRYKYEILTVKRVTADEEFAHTIHTFLLKDTGSAFQDNVYILYGRDEGRNSNSGVKGYDWVTCVADEAGTLRFTIPRFESGDTFIVVHTWPE